VFEPMVIVVLEPVDGRTGPMVENTVIRAPQLEFYIEYADFPRGELETAEESLDILPSYA